MASTTTLQKALAALTQATSLASGSYAVTANPTDGSSALVSAEVIKAYCQNGMAAASAVEAVTESLDDLSQTVQTINARTANADPSHLPVRYLGAASTYDGGAALLKALSLGNLNNQGYWYFSINGVRIVCQLEIKAMNSRAVATIYGGVRVGSDGSLTQDMAFHILATYYQDGAWAAWTEYFDATKVTALETRAAALETRAAAVEAKATANATAINTNAAAIQTNANDIATLKTSVATVTDTAAATQSVVATHETRITALETESGTQGDSIDALQTSLTSLSSRTATVENTAKANAANITKNAAAISVNAQGIETNKESIEALTARVDEMQLFYGVEWDTQVSAPALTRIGSPSLHRTLPIQSKMRGCLLADDGTVNEYLPSSDWTAATRDGSKGQVMVEIPEHYRKCETDGTTRRVKLSTLPLPGYKRVPLMYVSAYEAAMDKTVSSTPKLASVVNTTEAFRGSAQSAYDTDDYTSLGTARSGQTRAVFRQWPRNRNGGDDTRWNMYTYAAHLALYWLFAVEYATRDSQAAYNAQPTAEGYRQGGLAPGVTTIEWGNSSVQCLKAREQGLTGWNALNWYSPFVPCGYTDALGNGTGVVAYTLPACYGAPGTTVEVPRYRGVENPFGHIYKHTDGCNIVVHPTEANGGDGRVIVYTADDPSLFNDTGVDGFTLQGDMARPASNQYVKDILFGQDGCILPTLCTGGSSSTFFCDAAYVGDSGFASITENQLAFPSVGGFAAESVNGGGPDGMACCRVYGYNMQNIQYGTRLCYHP